MVVPEGLGGRYELRGLLGRGGMADVREGWDRRLDRPVAIMLLRPELSPQTDIRLRFEAEAKAAATLNHPHVVAVYDSGEDNGVPYIVMERLPGHSMAEDIATGPIPVERVRTILIEVLDALAAAHSVGILHRDIKPANILFSTTGAVKVSDFGIAKSTHTDPDITSYTVTGHIVGTIAYLSPQRLTGQQWQEGRLTTHAPRTGGVTSTKRLLLTPRHRRATRSQSYPSPGQRRPVGGTMTAHGSSPSREARLPRWQ